MAGKFLISVQLEEGRKQVEVFFVVVLSVFLLTAGRQNKETAKKAVSRA